MTPAFRPLRPFHLLAATALAVVLPQGASAADAAVAAPTAASAPEPLAGCAAPGADRAANAACSLKYARRAEAARAAGRGQEAVAEMAMAEKLSPDDLRFAAARAGIALALGGPVDRARLAAALKAAPDDLGLLMAHGGHALGERRYDEAIADADRAIALRPTAVLPYEMRGSADFLKGDDEAAARDVARTLQIDPKSAEALRVRGALRVRAADYAGATADYKLAHRVAPKPEDPIAIGSAQFLQRQFSDSAASLDQPAPPAPRGTYWLIWRYLALARLGGPVEASGSLGPGSPPGTAAVWPMQVVDFYLRRIDGAALVAAAHAAQDKQDESQVCEAHFYLAEDALLEHRADAATALFKAALKECPQNFREYDGARAELQAGAGVAQAVPATSEPPATLIAPPPPAPAASSAAPPAAASAAAPSAPPAEEPADDADE